MEKVKRRWRVLVAALVVVVAMGAADGSWLKMVPDGERGKQNPYGRDADAAAAGGRVFEEHCVKCHGDDALGRRGRPSLRSDRVQSASDGELFWLLRNGNLKKRMPSWSALPEQTRWQLITYVKSLGKSWF